MSSDAWITLIVLLAMVGALARDLVRATYAVFGAMLVLLVTRVVEPDRALGGFATTAPLTIAALYVLAGAVDKTGALQPALDVVLRQGTSPRRQLARLVAPSGALSAFLANTPIVAMLVPPVVAWCDRHDIAPSRVLIPLSYCTILGGTITVVGTSTNLLVSSLLEDTGDPLGMFELTAIGLPVAVVGTLVVLLLAPVVLPDRRAPFDADEEHVRDFVVSMRVVPGGPTADRTVEDAGLRRLAGLFLVEVERSGDLHAPVGPGFRLRGDDVLTFVGRAEDVVELQRQRGLASAEHSHVLAVDDGRHTYFEAVIGADSPLVGQNLRDIGFRGKYQAAVLAVHRSGQRVQAKLGDVVLRAGDTLVLLAGPDFKTRWNGRRDFLLVARLGGTSPVATKRMPVVLAALLAVVTLPALGVATLLEVTVVAALGLVATGVLTTAEARSAIQLDVVVMIGAAFGLGAAITDSGLAGTITDGLLDTLGSRSDLGAIVAVVLLTIVLTELVTNAAAAVIAVPVALEVAARTGLDPRVLTVAVAVTASCSFLTPIGYQTNTMVYGPGGYRAVDYLRLGVPLTVAVAATVVVGTLVLA
ncbi:MAG: SLC13 family permease [Acidimicrobiales bacterium]|nr:SLC13 family permease [Acidimicrobiales bacterium]